MSQDFKVLPIRFDKECSGYHELFIKEHSVKVLDEKKPPGRTLLVLNIPCYVTLISLKRIFSICGKIQFAHFQATASSTTNTTEENISGFKVAYIVYKKRESLVKALQLKTLAPVSSDKNPISVGLDKWVKEYNSSITNIDKLEEEVNRNLKKIEENERKKKLKEKDEVDEDGWTVVTKKGRNPGLSRKETVETKLKAKNKMKSMKKELKNFYTFQLKEQKMEHIAALRKSFEESKRKINVMKTMRTFKPY